MPARQYRSTVEAKTLNQTITNSSTAIVLNSVTTLPTTYPYTLVLNPDTLTEEIVTVTSSGGGNTLNVTRGQDGTTAQGHNLGAAVRHMITARDLQEPQDHINNGGYHIIVCTSSTRPGSPVDGQHIYETDTDKTLSWDGTSWNPVSGAASYQPGEPANPSVGSLWVDSDESASQLNTNDFLLKSDASAASGYVSKVGGDTVVASGAAVKPLVLKGASSQTANLQEWQDSTGAVVASVSPTGNIVGSGLTLIKKQTVGTGVSSVNITAAFSATYDNYLVIYTGGTGNNNYISLRIGNVATANYYNTAQSYSYSNSAPTQAGQAATTAHSNINYMTASGGAVRCEIMQPFLSTFTYMSTLGIEATAAAGGGVYERKGMLSTTASYTSFDIISNGTMTGGTIYVYGYGTN
jgi:hypothetical protein